MKKIVQKMILTIVALLILGGYFYVTLPAISIHSTGFWFSLVLILVIAMGLFIKKKRMSIYEIKYSKSVKIWIGAIALVILVFFIGSLASSEIFNAKKYQQLLQVEKGEFATDIKELSYDQIPLLDRDSATLLGNRKMGSMVDMVSQFEVDTIYSQINYNDKPVRVSPLRYASAIKWLTNQSEGIPAYVLIDMATQDTKLVKLEEGIKYSNSEFFNRNIYRHLRFRYPTYIFNELSFEIDEEGTPYWIWPGFKYNIGLFGGKTIGRVVLCNAITGETQDLAVSDVPQWVDRAYSADLLVQLYDYHGTLKHGFLNSVFGQKDCLNTTSGYNYLAIDDDVWVYTGVTSVSGDQSNVGFVLMNQRTMETKFYEIEGATEESAMGSAEGQVQNLKYVATFPLLLNINEQPTYFIALKDNAGLVKKYAMVNVQKYQLVGIGDTVSECESNYKELLMKEGIDTEEGKAPVKAGNIKGIIEKMVPVVIDGNTHYYVMIQGSEDIFDVAISGEKSTCVSILTYDVGQEIALTYVPREEGAGPSVCKVLQIGE